MGNLWGRRVAVGEEEEERPVCRNCSKPAEPGNLLYSPCRCDGKRKWVHKGCLDGRNIVGVGPCCLVCHYFYDIRRDPKRLSFRDGVYRAMSDVTGSTADLMWLIVAALLCLLNVLNPIEVNAEDEQLRNLIVYLYFFMVTVNVIGRNISSTNAIGLNVSSTEAAIVLNNLQRYGQLCLSIFRFTRSILLVNNYVDMISYFSLVMSPYWIDQDLLDELMIPLKVLLNTFSVIRSLMMYCFFGFVGISFVISRMRAEINYHFGNFDPYGTLSEVSNPFVVVVAGTLATDFLTAYVINPLVINNQMWNEVFTCINSVSRVLCWYAVQIHFLVRKFSSIFERYFLDKSVTTGRIVNYSPENDPGILAGDISAEF